MEGCLEASYVFFRILYCTVPTRAVSRRLLQLGRGNHVWVARTWERALVMDTLPNRNIPEKQNRTNQPLIPRKSRGKHLQSEV